MTKLMLLLTAMVAVVLSVLAVPAEAMTGPFTWAANTWCPSYATYDGCNTTQHPGQYTVSFAPSHVSRNSAGGLNLYMGSGVSGAVNTWGHEAWAPKTRFITNVTIPCNTSGTVVNWPAVWTDGTQGSWPAHGEIDIAEGVAGRMGFAYHYLDRFGQHKSYGVHPAGNWCGTHRFSALYELGAVSWYWDYKIVGKVTSGMIGVPIAHDPMEFQADYGAGQYGGPTVANRTMKLNSFQISHS